MSESGKPKLEKSSVIRQDGASLYPQSNMVTKGKFYKYFAVTKLKQQYSY